MIIGMPWSVKENTHINWTQLIVVVQQGQDWISLLMVKQGDDTSAHLANMMSGLLKRKQMDNTFLGFVRMIKEEENVAEMYKGKSDIGVIQLWREDLPEEIKEVLREYDDAFLKDLLIGFPPICKGHEFEIKLEDHTPPMHYYYIG